MSRSERPDLTPDDYLRRVLEVHAFGHAGTLDRMMADGNGDRA